MGVADHSTFLALESLETCAEKSVFYLESNRIDAEKKLKVQAVKAFESFGITYYTPCSRYSSILSKTVLATSKASVDN